MKIKVLHILGGMGRGGAPSFIINNMNKTNKQNVEYDFLIRKDNCVFNDEIKKHGGVVTVVPEFPKHLIRNYFATNDFFEKHKDEYSVVHIHANALLYMLPIRLALKKWNCKIIIHSHNTKSNVCGMYFIHMFNRTFNLPKSCLRLACSQDAGKWMYGNKPFEVINNAIDSSKFIYSIEKNKKIRGELGISEDTLVIGNISRFEHAKNHSFMISVFAEFIRMTNKKVILVLVGDGSLKDIIIKQVNNLGLHKKVIFTGTRNDTYNLYSAFDLFLMPSFFEGLPFTLIEAQAAGVPCVISKNITTEVDLTDLIIRLNLEDGCQAWAKKISSIIFKDDRKKYVKNIIEAAYDTRVTAKRLEEIYTY